MSATVNFRPAWAGGERFAIAARHVLVIDDQRTARIVLERIIHSIDAKIEVKMFSSPLEAIEWARGNVPDLVLTDYKMDEIDGIETIRRLRQLRTCEDVPIVMVTIMEDSKLRHAAFDVGVSDFLVKPYDWYECRARCRNLLSLYEQHLLLKDRTSLLEREIAEAVRELRFRERETIMLAANLSEYHAHQDGLRIVRVARYVRMVAEGMELSPEFVERIEVACALHDVGKIGIADDILLAVDAIDEAQKLALREHTEIGYKLLEQSSSEFLKLGAEICMSHHERYDGSGYPQKLNGRNIPLSARIVAVALAFDFLTSNQTGDDASVIEKAMRNIVSRKGIDFDPVCVEALRCQLEKAGEVVATFADSY